jgi:hypothetical protein
MEPAIEFAKNPAITVAIATGIGAAVGSLFANFFIAWNGWRERKAADRRHRREWALKTAVEEFNRNVDLAKYVSDKGKQATILPLDTHLISTLALLDAIGDEPVNLGNVHAILDRMHEVTAAAVENTEAYTAGRKRKGESV